MELLGSIFDAETDQLKTIAADLQRNMDQGQEVARALRKRSRSVSRSSEINGGNLATEWATPCLSKTMKKHNG